MQITPQPFIKGIYTKPFVTKDNVFSEQELHELKKYHAAINTHSARLGAELKLDENIRKSDVSLVKLDSQNGWIFQRLLRLCDSINQGYYNYDLYGFSDYQYTVYKDTGSHYDAHVDMVFGTNAPALARKLSMSIILSDTSEYEGGDFEINLGNKPIKVEQKFNRVIAFPSFVVHKVTPLISGTRKSMVVWAMGPKFK